MPIDVQALLTSGFARARVLLMLISYRLRPLKRSGGSSIHTTRQNVAETFMRVDLMTRGYTDETGQQCIVPKVKTEPEDNHGNSTLAHYTTGTARGRTHELWANVWHVTWASAWVVQVCMRRHVQARHEHRPVMRQASACVVQRTSAMAYAGCMM